MTGVAEGLRVLDFTWFAVGPVTTKYLADNGAEVIKIESRQRPDGLRMAPPFKGDPSVSLNRSQYFGNYNSSKKSVSIDMSTDEGKELIRALVPHFDIVAESYRAGTMVKWGLGYEKLRELRPDLIYLATCLQGQTGPRAGYAGFGTMLAAISGFYNVSGYSPDEITPVHGPYTDFVAPRFSTFALLAAIDHRRRTGEGQMIDMSQYEASLNFLSPAMTDYFATGRIAHANGNHSARFAPHGAYPCLDEAGRERWIALSVENDEQWASLLRILGDEAGRTRFPSHADRLQRPGEVDQYVSALTATRAAADLVPALQAAGIAAYPVQNCADLRVDENMVSWGYIQDLDQAEAGSMPYDGFAYRLDRTPGGQTAAPSIGEHTDEVLSSLLGLSAAEIGRLRDAKILN
jgi:crotonobetainyl-CoA:carnitine CoA-transferase CaiB-like acyl-CoA transferase